MAISICCGHKGIGVIKKPMEEGNNNNNNIRPPAASSAPPQTQQQLVNERRSRPLKEQALNCPRCNSTNTKFCYYNNYSLTQPRYFCKSCRRYWTEGGSLRNVPVGGGSRKNKRHSSSTSSSAPSTANCPNVNNPSSKINTHLQSPLSMPPVKPFQGHDLNLAFPNSSFSELLGGFSSNMNNGGPLVQMPETASVYGGGYGLHDFSAAAGMKFPFDGIANIDHGDANNGNGMQGGGGRLLFPYGGLTPVSIKSSARGENGHDQQGGDHPQMFWSGANMGAGGGSW